MKAFFAMRRANGDWFALDDHGVLRVPVFRNAVDASIARSRDSGMECFRPITLDRSAVADLADTGEAQTQFWLVKDPDRRLSLAARLDYQQLVSLIENGDGLAAETGIRK